MLQVFAVLTHQRLPAPSLHLTKLLILMEPVFRSGLTR
jgi:hypothetical protein